MKCQDIGRMLGAMSNNPKSYVSTKTLPSDSERIKFYLFFQYLCK